MHGSSNHIRTRKSIPQVLHHPQALIFFLPRLWWYFLSPDKGVVGKDGPFEAEHWQLLIFSTLTVIYTEKFLWQKRIAWVCRSKQTYLEGKLTTFGGEEGWHGALAITCFSYKWVVGMKEQTTLPCARYWNVNTDVSLFDIWSIQLGRRCCLFHGKLETILLLRQRQEWDSSSVLTWTHTPLEAVISQPWGILLTDL